MESAKPTMLRFVSYSINIVHGHGHNKAVIETYRTRTQRPSRANVLKKNHCKSHSTSVHGDSETPVPASFSWPFMSNGLTYTGERYLDNTPGLSHILTKSASDKISRLEFCNLTCSDLFIWFEPQRCLFRVMATWILTMTAYKGRYAFCR